MSNKYRKHQNLIAEILPRLQQTFPHGRFFDRHVGKFVYIRFFSDLAKGKCSLSDWKKYIVSINQSGMSDVWAIFKTRHGAIYLEYEFKSGNAIKSGDQKKWGSFLKTMNTDSIEVRENNFNEVVIKTKKALNLKD